VPTSWRERTSRIQIPGACSPPPCACSTSYPENKSRNSCDTQGRLREPALIQAPTGSPGRHRLRHPAQEDLGSRRLAMPGLRVSVRTRGPSRPAQEPIRGRLRGQPHHPMHLLPPGGSRRVKKITPGIRRACRHLRAAHAGLGINGGTAASSAGTAFAEVNETSPSQPQHPTRRPERERPSPNLIV
jgi:hypothetical protein